MVSARHGATGFGTPRRCSADLVESSAFCAAWVFGDNEIDCGCLSIKRVSVWYREAALAHSGTGPMGLHFAAP